MDNLELEAFLPYRLNRLGAAISQAFQKVYRKRYDLSVAEWRVLATLGQFGEATATAIGAHSHMHKTKVSRAVRALEDRGWLKRRQSDDDRREEILSLRGEGRKAYADIVPRALKFEQRILEALGRDGEALGGALSRLEEHLGLAAVSAPDGEAPRR